MTESDRWLERHLDTIQSQNEEMLVEVREVRVELRQHRADDMSQFDSLRDLVAEVQGARREETGAHRVIKQQTKWFFGIVATVLTAAAAGGVGWLIGH